MENLSTFHILFLVFITSNYKTLSVSVSVSFRYYILHNLISYVSKVA